MSFIVSERPSEPNFSYIEQILRKIDELETTESNRTDANSYYLHTGFVYLKDNIKPEANKSNYSYVSEPKIFDSESNSFYTNSKLDLSVDSSVAADQCLLNKPRELVTSFTVNKNFYKKPENHKDRISSSDSVSMTDTKSKNAFVSSEKLIIPEIILPTTADQKIEIKEDDNEASENLTESNEEEQLERMEQPMPKSPNLPSNRREDFHQPKFMKPQAKIFHRPVGSRNLSNQNRLKRFLSKFNPLKIKLKREHKYSRK